MERVVIAKRQIPNDPEQRKVRIDRPFAKEEWGMPERNLESFQQTIRVRTNLRGALLPLFETAAAKPPFLVPHNHSALRHIRNRRHVVNVHQLESAVLDFVFEEIDDDRLQAIER